MQIYELYLYSYRRSYRGYWSSIDKAIELLPDCARFRESIRWDMPSSRQEGALYFEPHYKTNHEIRPTLIQKGLQIEIWIKGHVTSVTEITELPEIKKAGEPYIPAMTNKKPLPDVIEDIMIGKIDIEPIDLDQVRADFY